MNRRRDDSNGDDGDGGGDPGKGGSGGAGGSRAAGSSGSLQPPAAAAAASSAVASDSEGKAPLQTRSRRHYCCPQEDSGRGSSGSNWPGALGALQVMRLFLFLIPLQLPKAPWSTTTTLWRYLPSVYCSSSSDRTIRETHL